MVGRLHGERKTDARTLEFGDFRSDTRVKRISEGLGKAYAVDISNRLDADLASFVDYSSKKELIVEHFISGFQLVWTKSNSKIWMIN